LRRALLEFLAEFGSASVQPLVEPFDAVANFIDVDALLLQRLTDPLVVDDANDDDFDVNAHPFAADHERRWP
jgi:hypothetical protein